VADASAAGWADEHHDYPATDIFVGCGAEIVAPVSGVLLEVRRVDGYDEAVDNPATRGGMSISILGDDGVRYYLAHFDSIDGGWEPGVPVVAGARLGAMGRTGRAGACHLHFAISPPCPGIEWSVRRGVVWPYPYLDAWRDGEQRSPVDEVAAWTAANPGACAEAMADPNAADA
jgi:murein DD-endopeptidase MepM/ murein hydrolase activator NlpD